MVSGPGSSGRCKALNCKSKRGRGEKLSFFRFPFPDADRLRIWVQRSGDIRLTKYSQERFHCMYMCSKHFDTRSFMNPRKRSRLNHNVVPEIFTEPYLSDADVEGLFKTPMPPRGKASRVVRQEDCENDSPGPVEIIDYNQSASDIIAEFLSFVAGPSACEGKVK